MMLATLNEWKWVLYSGFLHLVTYYVAALLFGAPYFSLMTETLIFSGLLSSLTVLPLTVFCGTSYIHVLELMSIQRLKKRERSAKFIIMLTVFGAWVGAFVIPLDWERWWQEWPISCCISMTVFSSIAWTLNFTFGKWYPSFLNIFTSTTPSNIN